VAHAITKSKCELNVSILAESVVLEGESQELFLELLAEIDGESSQNPPVEHALVQKMAVAHWLQFRLWTLERTAIHHQIRKQAQPVGCKEHKATCTSMAFRTLADESRSLGSPDQLLPSEPREFQGAFVT